MLKFKQKRSGLSLVEILLTISIIAAGVLPLLAGLSNMTEAALEQRDILSAMTLGKFQMDAWITQFQTADKLLTTVKGPDFEEYSSFTVVNPPIPAGNVALLTPEGKPYRDWYYNGANYRITSSFILQDGENGTSNLTTMQKIVYRIHIGVWRIKNPMLNDSQTAYNLYTSGFGDPSFSRGDELLYQLDCLYSQGNRFLIVEEESETE